MGIVVRTFLDYKGTPDAFQREITAKFPCCQQPLEDLKNAFVFWADLKRCVEEIAEPLGAQELADDMNMANGFLIQQQRAPCSANHSYLQLIAQPWIHQKPSSLEDWQENRVDYIWS